MKNNLAIPIAILVASLILLVVAILMTPEIEVVEDPSFDLIVTAPGVGQAQRAPVTEGDAAAVVPAEQDDAPLAADMP